MKITSTYDTRGFALMVVFISPDQHVWWREHCHAILIRFVLKDVFQYEKALQCHFVFTFRIAGSLLEYKPKFKIETYYFISVSNKKEFPGALLWKWFELSTRMPYKVWDAIMDPFTDFDGTALAVWR